VPNAGLFSAPASEIPVVTMKIDATTKQTATIRRRRIRFRRRRTSTLRVEG
jgi:hypothetical protein